MYLSRKHAVETTQKGHNATIWTQLQLREHNYGHSLLRKPAVGMEEQWMLLLIVQIYELIC